MGTIIQGYGPIYGEPVNGTVQGRPNGSVYVPLSNVVKFDFPSRQVICNVTIGGGKRVRFCDEDGYVLKFSESALSQDLSSNMRNIISTSPDLDTIVSSMDLVAGNFNISNASSFVNNYELDPDTTYYLAVQLLNNGVPVATSEVAVCTVQVLS